MSFENWKLEISRELSHKLDELLPDHKFKEVINYSVFPTGKLFRPLLVYALAQDLGEINKNHTLFAVAIELHHTYTLIHDDLPAMDDDDYRRGRLSSHKKFSEWEAILAGDALINLSYEILAELPSLYLNKLLKYFSSFTGPQGLIFGQVLDLNDENKNLDEILRLHELKTARLIQLAFIGAAIINDKQEHLEKYKELGKAIGVNFQLLDDLCELTKDLGHHEKEINPFIHYPSEEILAIISNNNKRITNICQEHQLNTIREYIEAYLTEIKEKLENNFEPIYNYIKLNPEKLKDITSL